MRIKMSGGGEVDALTRSVRHFYNWNAGERKSIKRQYNKRLRKAARPADFDPGLAPFNTFTVPWRTYDV